MAYDIGATVSLDGEAEFRRSIKNINTGIRTLGTEMAVVTSAFLGQEKSEAALRAKNDVLGRTVDELNKKLEIQKEQLAKATEAYAAGDPRIEEYKQAVNKTQAEMNKANAQISQNTQLIEEQGEEAQKAAEKEKKAAEKSAAAAKKKEESLKNLKKVALAASAAVVAAMGVLMKDSLEGYAEFEQLTGGVETLFGDSADTIKKYANDAYKTAGLTANEYMETVTGFSASLISSLGGDTAKAAELADQAITDMADNANKMGTDISSIQNAYQGFAKGQFNMLDNLKLGYGGTKTEMERLLAGAEKISGIHYDISSFADITEAIHVVQTEMGITGTTAKEASSTIQGSLAAMGAAWKNLVVGMADENADLEQLISNFVDSVWTAAGNILPRIKQILVGLGDVLVELAPQLLEAGGELVSTLAQGILDGIPKLADAALSGAQSIGSGLEGGLPEVLQGMISFVYQLVQTLLDNAPKFLEAAGTLAAGLLQGLVDYLPTLMEWIPYMIKGLGETIAENLPAIIDLGVQLVTALAGALIEALPVLLEAIPEIAAALLEAAADIGKALLEGVWNGIKSLGSWLKDQIKGFFSGLVDGVKDLLGIHSPSRVFGAIGKNMAAGLGEGWDDAFGSVQRDINKSLTFDPGTDWARKMAGNMEMDLASPVYAGRMEDTANQTAAAVGAQGAQSGEIVVNITETIDGKVLARNQYRYNQAEIQRMGPSLIKGG